MIIVSTSAPSTVKKVTSYDAIYTDSSPQDGLVRFSHHPQAELFLLIRTRLIWVTFSQFVFGRQPPTTCLANIVSTGYLKGRHEQNSRLQQLVNMMTTYVQLAYLFVVFGGDALGQLTRGDVSSDGLCTYTFRDICVSQRMRDVMELRAVVDSLQAQLTLVNKVVAAIPDLRTTMKQLEVKVDDIKEKTQEEAGGCRHLL